MFADTPLGEATVERESPQASAPRADAMHHALNCNSTTRKGKPLAEQPVGQRRRGRWANDTVDDELSSARDHLGNGNV